MKNNPIIGVITLVIVFVTAITLLMAGIFKDKENRIREITKDCHEMLTKATTSHDTLLVLTHIPEYRADDCNTYFKYEK